MTAASWAPTSRSRQPGDQFVEHGLHRPPEPLVGIEERLRGESLDGEFGPDAEELRSPPRDGDFRPHIGVGGELRRPRTLRHKVQDPSSGATSTRVSENVGLFPMSPKAVRLMAFTVAPRFSLRH